MSERSPLVSTTRREPLLEESKRSTNDRLFMFWVALVIIVTLLLVSVFGIDRAAQNAANHQTHYKLNTCVVWSTAAWVIITVIGMLTLKARGYSTKLLTGTFYGCLVGFSVLSLVFTVYFVGAAWHKDYQGRITTGETAFSVTSLVIGVLCAGFSNAIFTYRHSIIKVNAADSGLPTATTSPRSFT